MGTVVFQCCADVATVIQGNDLLPPHSKGLAMCRLVYLRSTQRAGRQWLEFITITGRYKIVKLGKKSPANLFTYQPLVRNTIVRF
ncbi:hypothetical protein MJO29_006718 [Puccinia striiformis f. sp. tritici]|nr:hypothetical protein MJO29_006718 [Puccinia striiformis f. sp. tritici]